VSSGVEQRCHAQEKEEIVAEGELLIKKYGNRRLYDTESSRYITLEDLSQIVKAGRDVRVVDAKTNKDLTKTVLLQIISESEKDHDVLPVSFLKKMIQLSDQAVRDSLHRYLRVSLDAFLTAQKEFEERYKSFAGALMNPMSSIASLNPMLWPVSLMGRPGEPGAVPPMPTPTPPSPAEAAPPPEEEQPKPAAATPAAAAAEEQLRVLQEQVAQMQEALSKLQRKK